MTVAEKITEKNIELPAPLEGYRQKDLQKAAVFHSLCLHHSSSRRELIDELKLRSTTVSTAVQELIDDNVVLESGQVNSGRRGRPETRLQVDFDRLVAISLFVEDRAIIAAMTNLAGTVLHEERVEIERTSGNSAFEKRIVSLAREVEKHKPAHAEIVGIGISLIGTVDAKNKRWVEAARWGNVDRLDFSKIEKKLGIPLLLRRNLDSELEHQMYNNSDQPMERELLFHWGFGMGAAYAHQGRLLGAELGRFVDIGHVRLIPGSKSRCRCGRIGCLEADAAIYGLIPCLKRRFPNLTEDSIRMQEILAVPGVLEEECVRRAVNGVQLALSILCRVFYPERIYLVGSFFANGTILEAMQEVLSTSPMINRDQSIQRQLVGDSFRGCIHGNVYSFFQTRMQSLLRSRM